jgi:outer membrane protein assembly factor BamB
VWASTLRGGTAVAEALSPDGTRLFVLGYVGPAVKSGTVAYSTATGAQLWAQTYPPENAGGPDEVIAVSPDGAQVYVTGHVTGQGDVTIAYAAGTGRQLWVSRYNKSVRVLSVAVSPDGTTVYEAGTGRVSGRGPYIAVIAYDAATGRQRWLRYYTRVKRAGAALGAVAVSPDGTTVYVAGQAGALVPSSYSLLVLAYRATGTLKWATRYANRYTGGAYAGGAFGGPIVLRPGGSDLYVAGTVSSKYGHHVAATFAFRAATGTCRWLDPDAARGGGGKVAVTPDGKTVIFAGDRTGDAAGGYAITSYDASSGAARWARRAPLPGNAPSASAGLVIDPHGDTAFVASPGYGGGYDIAAWSVARGTELWTTRYAAAKVYSPVAIAESPDGTRLFLTGSVGSNGGMTTVAYQT